MTDPLLGRAVSLCSLLVGSSLAREFGNLGMENEF
jgi:hypothetical protein